MAAVLLDTAEGENLELADQAERGLVEPLVRGEVDDALGPTPGVEHGGVLGNLLLRRHGGDG